MKKTILFCLAICSSLFAASDVQDNTSTNGCCIRDDLNSLLKIGGTYRYMWIKPNGFDTFEGSLGGAQISYEYLKNNSFYGALLFDFLIGSTKDSPQKRDLFNYVVSERIGYTYGCCRFRFSPFTGFGFNYFKHELKQPNVSTLTFKYKEFFVPVGFIFTGQVVQSLTMGLEFTWMPQVYPAVRISPTGVANWVIKERLENFLVELPIQWTIPRCSQFILEMKPSFKCWYDGRTTASAQGAGSLDVPANRYMSAGILVNLGWFF